MANRIGNYIHYHKSNYIKYGIGVKNKFDPQFSYGQYRNRLLKEYQDNKLHAFAIRYEKTLNSFYSGVGRMRLTEEMSKEKQKQLEQAINNVLLKQLKHVSTKLVVGTDGRFKSVKQISSASQPFHYTKAVVNEHFKKRTTSIHRDTLKNYLIDIQNKASMLTNTANSQELKSILNKLNTTADKIDQYLKKNLPSSSQKFSIDGKLGSILNQILECYHYNFSLSNAHNNGIIGEVMGAFAAEFVIQGANVEIDKIEKEVVKKLTSTQRSAPKAEIKTSGKHSGLNHAFSSVFAIDWSKWTMDQGASQNKADITVDFDNKPIGISYKKYSANSVKKFGVKTVSETSLLTYLIDEDTNFINHWLNLVTLADESKANIDDSFLLKKRQEAQSIMKLIIALKSVRGAAGREGNANIFAINKGKNIFKVYTLYDIIKKITLNKSLTGVRVEGMQDRYIQEWSGKRLVYSMKESPNRISELLSKIHEEKISVHLTNAIGLFS